jgi:Arc/MetJ-type ribon-helix-helix transcriptional regulator
MDSANINVRISGELRRHLLRQTDAHGLYENASEYVRDLIRRDLKEQREAADWLTRELQPALTANSKDYIAVTAEEVIKRNRRRKPHA